MAHVAREPHGGGPRPGAPVPARGRVRPRSSSRRRPRASAPRRRRSGPSSWPAPAYHGRHLRYPVSLVNPVPRTSTGGSGGNKYDGALPRSHWGLSPGWSASPRSHPSLAPLPLPLPARRREASDGTNTGPTSRGPGRPRREREAHAGGPSPPESRGASLPPRLDTSVRTRPGSGTTGWAVRTLRGRPRRRRHDPPIFPASPIGPGASGAFLSARSLPGRRGRASGSSSTSAPACPPPTTPTRWRSGRAGSPIVYVDNDPLVLAHARALLTSAPGGMTQLHRRRSARHRGDPRRSRPHAGLQPADRADDAGHHGPAAPTRPGPGPS